MPKVFVCKELELKIGEKTVVEVEEDFVLVVHMLSGFYAIEDRCSHDDNELLGGETTDAETITIKCPRHGAKFDLQTGKALSLPAVKAVKSYAVLVEDGMVWVLSRD